jgi:hypothetical protein
VICEQRKSQAHNSLFRSRSIAHTNSKPPAHLHLTLIVICHSGPLADGPRRQRSWIPSIELRTAREEYFLWAVWSATSATLVLSSPRLQIYPRALMSFHRLFQLSFRRNTESTVLSVAGKTNLPVAAGHAVNLRFKKDRQETCSFFHVQGPRKLCLACSE